MSCLRRFASRGERLKMVKSSDNCQVRVNYPDIDIMKLLMAFLVVEIHARPLMNFALAQKILDGIDVIAVPFFFLASGFLCFQGLGAGDFRDVSSAAFIRVRKTIFKLIRLYVTWTLLFLPLTIFGNMLKGNSPLRAILYFVRGTLFIGENYYSWPLWYLLASAVGFALVYYLLRGGVELTRIVFLSFCLLLIGYCISFVQGWEEAPVYLSLPCKAYSFLFGSSRNGLFEGFFYIAVGASFGLRLDFLDKMPLLFDLALAVLGLAGNYLVSNDPHLPFCVAVSIGLFLLSIRRHGSCLNSYAVARHISTVVYLVHMYFIVVFVYGFGGGVDPNLYANDVNRLLLYLFAICGSFSVSALVFFASKKMPVVKTIFGI